MCAARLMRAPRLRSAIDTRLTEAVDARLIVDQEVEPCPVSGFGRSCSADACSSA